MKHFILLLFLLGMQTEISAQLNVSSGKIEQVTAFPSQYISPRTIDIWLPEGYNSQQKYAVLYMHDGQMLYDAETTWNKQEWGVDEEMSILLTEKSIRPTIVVGIYNSPTTRHSDYFPQTPFESLEKAFQDSLYQVKRNETEKLFNVPVQSNLYLKFLVEELKPYIDSHYATFTDKEHTFVMGSSMGGLISLYAICEYPQIFGGAGCISTHWPGAFDPKDERIPKAFIQYLELYLPCALDHKIYFDYGTETIDAWYEPYQKWVDLTMENSGFESSHWITRKFEGADHSERSWKARLQVPLKFLLE